MRTHLKKNWKLLILVLRDCKTALVSHFPTLFSPYQNFSEVFTKKGGKEWTLKKYYWRFWSNYIYNEILDGQTEGKHEEIYPRQRMELIHSEDASKLYCHNSKLCLRWFSSGFQCCASRVLLVFCHQMLENVLGYYENQQGSEDLDWKPLLQTLLVLPKFSSWFSMTPLLHLQLLCLLYLLWTSDPGLQNLSHYCHLY